MSKKTIVRPQEPSADSTAPAKESAAGRPGMFRRQPWVVAVVAVLALGVFGAAAKYLEADARRQEAARMHQTPLAPAPASALDPFNPFLAASTPSPTPQLSKEYIYAGSRMLAVEDANANAAPPADLAVWRKSTGYWYVLGGQSLAQTAFQWGGTDDDAVPGDYDGDGKTDFAVFRRTNGTWYISTSSSGGTNYIAVTFGIGSSDKPAPADYDGDGRTDLAVFRPSDSTFYIQSSSDPNGGFIAVQHGLSGDVPAPADYDGDGKADIALWRAGSASFYTLFSSTNFTTGESVTMPQTSSELPISGDYDGDGRADYAIKNGNSWFYKQSSDNQMKQVVHGDPTGDLAVPNDYDGDGKMDIALWREATGYWHIRQSSNLQLRSVQWGTQGDIPVPAYYRR